MMAPGLDGIHNSTIAEQGCVHWFRKMIQKMKGKRINGDFQFPIDRTASKMARYTPRPSARQVRMNGIVYRSFSQAIAEFPVLTPSHVCVYGRSWLRRGALP